LGTIRFRTSCLPSSFSLRFMLCTTG